MSDTNMKCPKCGQTEAFFIAATIWGQHTINGFDCEADNLPSYDNIWDQYAACQCPECGEEGLIEGFLDEFSNHDPQWSDEAIGKMEAQHVPPLATHNIKGA